MVGTLNGVTYTDATTLKPTFATFYAGGITPANSEDISAFVNDDPFQEYIVATDATLGGTLALRKSKIGLTYATTASAGDDTNGTIFFKTKYLNCSNNCKTIENG